MTHLEVIQRVWSEWTVTEKIGEGSFGQVFKAEKESFGIRQESAIKVIRIPSDEAELEKVKSSFGLDDEELRDYFYPQLDKLKKEIELMMKLDDINIVKIHDFEIKESLDSKIGWYILIRMELLECLEKYVKNNDMTVADVVSIGEDILSCLETCEENNIIHRDIKPANLFRNEKGVYKLGDFGIAKDVSASVGSLSYKGTENYMAPEVYMGKRYNSTIDIYALGIVLYKLLNRNRLPFMSQEKLTSASIEKAFQKRNTGEPLPKPMQASEAIYEVIKKMCAYRPEDRFQTAAEAKKALTEYKRTDGEELEAVLDISNKTRKLVGTESSNKETEKSIAELEYINPAKPEIKPAEQEQAMQAEPAIPVVKEESTTKDTVDTKETIQSQLFNEPDNIEQADEDLGNKTRSLFQEKEKPIVQESQSPENRQIINEENNESKKKKSKKSLIIGIGVAIVAITVLLFLAFGNNNASKVAIAKEIYADDNVFVIDEEEYKGKYIEYTTSLRAEEGELVERNGIYIGATKGGKPEGYG
ncbi:MAG: serine/threonine protein kinase, partial [Lachnospiraceae bacterium]